MISYTSLNMLFSKKFFSCRPESGSLIGRFALNGTNMFALQVVLLGVFLQVYVPKLLVYAQVR